MSERVVSYINLECGHTYRILPKEVVKTYCFCSRCNKNIRTIGTPKQGVDVLRATGRTTRMLEDVIASCGSDQKNIVVFGNTLKCAYILQDRMRRIIYDSGLDNLILKIRSKTIVYNGTIIDFCSVNGAEKRLGLGRETKVFTDHCVYKV